MAAYINHKRIAFFFLLNLDIMEPGINNPKIVSIENHISNAHSNISLGVCDIQMLTNRTLLFCKICTD